MSPRSLVLAGVATVYLVSGGLAQAQGFLWDTERYGGGAPRAGIGYGYSPIPRTNVSFDAHYAPGTIVINTSERRLYLVTGQGQALRYGIGVGRVGFSWAGTSHISAKREWPDWTPTPNILRRFPNLPRHIRGGYDNPLGARALYLGQTLYRIHGTNEPWRIGTEASSGCIRLSNEDAIDLYDRTRIGATVIVHR